MMTFKIKWLLVVTALGVLAGARLSSSLSASAGGVWQSNAAERNNAQSGSGSSIDSASGQVSLGPPKFFALAANAAGQIFAGTYASGVIRSTDNGEVWAPVNTGLTNRSVNCLVVNSSGKLFAGTNGGGVFSSTDQGKNWSPANSGIADAIVYALVVEPSGHLLAGTHDRGVWRSTNHGQTWRPINAGIRKMLVYALVVNRPGHLFAGTGSGVFRSTNHGALWTR